MTEIKFACPHCSQHIACDRDYADMCIVCPSCGKPMEVPRLSGDEASHPDMCLVASIPQPKQRFSSRIPTIDLWTEHEWDERCQQATGAPEQVPAWLVSAIGTVIAAAILKAALSPGWSIVLCVLGGTALSGYLLAKNRMVSSYGNFAMTLFLLLLGIPFVALGVLFVGCVSSCQ